MIEALVKYIEERRYSVKVFPHVLRIYKQVDLPGGAEIAAKDWFIAREELKWLPIEVLYEQADRYMEEMDRAISERQKSGQ